MKISSKKIILLFIFGPLTNSLISQEIHKTYLQKKEKRHSNQWDITSLDSLVLYKNGTYHRTRSYKFHEIIYVEIKGDWKIKNDTLHLNVQQIKENKSDTEWTKINSKLRYLKKRRKLKPIDRSEFFATEHLNLVKK